ncbi:MAG: M18 family aminopeptidase, partial [Filifactor alocis]
MKYKNKYNKDLMEFLDGGVSPYHAVESMKKRLEKSGYTGLDIKESWSLNRGGKYYVDLGTTLIGFAIGENADRFRILGSHTDSPTFLIKPNADIQFKNYQKLNTETYGGPILNTWLDRPLSVAGRVDLKGDSVFETKAVLVDFEEPVAIIPNVAIHQNRIVNQGLELNKQKDMLPIIGLSGKKLEE